MRGEKLTYEGLIQMMKGSSPLARGKVAYARGWRAASGIIPACAGKSPRGRAGGRVPDHPRLRGEKKWLSLHIRLMGGSSPLARGKVENPDPRSVAARIIPACAGKRQFRDVKRPKSWDHPRLRGEKSMQSRKWFAASGSSPLARGKGSIGPRTHPNRRIIPACAGKSTSLQATSYPPQDHPRLRGEKLPARFSICCWEGSSPLARGKGAAEVGAGTRGRIIPACAGKRHFCPVLLEEFLDHPRLRGEKSKVPPSVFQYAGSSPLARGKACL